MLYARESLPAVKVLGGFTLAYVARELKVNYRTLAHWCEPGGLVSPAGAPKERKQKREVWLNFQDILELQLITGLRKHNVTFPQIRAAMASLRKSHPRLLHKILVEQTGDAPRAFLLAIRNKHGHVTDLVVVDLDERAVSALKAGARQLILIDIFEEARRIREKLGAQSNGESAKLEKDFSLA